MRNDEKTDTVQDRKADDPAVQPAAKVQPDKKITKKANRRPEKKVTSKRDRGWKRKIHEKGIKSEKIKGGDLQGLRTFFTTQVMMQHEIQHKTEKPLKNQEF